MLRLFNYLARKSKKIYGPEKMLKKYVRFVRFIGRKMMSTSSICMLHVILPPQILFQVCQSFPILKMGRSFHLWRENETNVQFLGSKNFSRLETKCVRRENETNDPFLGSKNISRLETKFVAGKWQFFDPRNNIQQRQRVNSSSIYKYVSFLDI